MTLQSMQRRLLEKLNGEISKQYTLEFRPDQRNDEEVFLLFGNQPELMAQISSIMALRQLLEIYGVGEPYIGMPYGQYVWQHKAPLLIQIHWRLRPERPYEPVELLERLNLNRNSPPRPYITLAARREAITWGNIKQLAGGSDGRMWGNCYSVARIKTTQGDDTIVKAPHYKLYGATREQAKADLKRMIMGICPESVYTMTTGEEEQTEGARENDPGLGKPSVKVYPVWFNIINWDLVDSSRRDTGRSTALGRLLRKKGAIDLSGVRPPLGVEDDIADLCRTGEELG